MLSFSFRSQIYTAKDQNVSYLRFYCNSEQLQNSMFRPRSVIRLVFQSLNWLLSSFHYLTGGQCLIICKDILVCTVLNSSISGQFCNKLLVYQQMLFTQCNIWYKNISDSPPHRGIWGYVLYLKTQWFSQGFSSSQVSEIKASGFCITGL